MILSYQNRLLPTKQQHRALETILESQRQLYNAALEERIEAYRKQGVSRSYFDQTKALTEWRRSDDEARLLPTNLQRATLYRVELAHQSFFRRLTSGEKPGFPRFRGKGRFHTFGFRRFSGITLAGRRLRFKGMPGSLRVHFHRDLPNAPIRSCTFRRDVKGWIVTFAVNIPVEAPRGDARKVGVDLGLATFAMLSDGTAIPNPRVARRAERKLQVAARAHSRAKRGSVGRTKALKALRRCHAAVVRRRNTYLHQVSADLVKKFDLIAVEALPIAGLAGSRLAKDVRDASWGRFISCLRYKAEKAGARVVEVNPVNTSQECSACGANVAKNLATRLHVCPGCGLTMDRDLNASRNILNRAVAGPGLRNVAGCGKRAGGNLGVRDPETLPVEWFELE